jgi:hypothetical protein
MFGNEQIGWSRLVMMSRREALPVRHYRKMLVPLTDVKYLYSLDGGIQWYPASRGVKLWVVPRIKTNFPYLRFWDTHIMDNIQI